MKKILFAMVCTLGAAACGGESRPAGDPSTVSPASTTESAPSGANRSDPSGGTTSTTNASTPTADGRDMSKSGGSDAKRAAAPANGSPATTTANTNATAPPAPGAPPVANNPGAANGTKDADNTKINDRDRHGALTPMDQGGGKDRDITAAIRRGVVADKSLSFSAKNVKIITNGGKVTLRGPVKSDQEKSTIEAMAKSAAGVSEVDNQLEVKK